MQNRWTLRWRLETDSRDTNKFDVIRIDFYNTDMVVERDEYNSLSFF